MITKICTLLLFFFLWHIIFFIKQIFSSFHQVDESSVEILHIVSGPDSMVQNSHVDSYRYPRAGMRIFSLELSNFAKLFFLPGSYTTYF